MGVVSLVLTEELEERKQIPFASAAISNISVGVAMQNNSFMKVDGSVGSLHLLDDRVESIFVYFLYFCFFIIIIEMVVLVTLILNSQRATLVQRSSSASRPNSQHN